MLLNGFPLLTSLVPSAPFRNTCRPSQERSERKRSRHQKGQASRGPRIKYSIAGDSSTQAVYREASSIHGQILDGGKPHTVAMKFLWNVPISWCGSADKYWHTSVIHSIQFTNTLTFYSRHHARRLYKLPVSLLSSTFPKCTSHQHQTIICLDVTVDE